MALDVTRGGHDAFTTLVAAEEIEQFLLTRSEAGVGVGEHGLVRLFARTFPVIGHAQGVFHGGFLGMM